VERSAEPSTRCGERQKWQMWDDVNCTLHPLTFTHFKQENV
jgi:hypothetical protein